MTEWRIEALGSNHLRSDFSCGIASLDAFIRTQITQYERRGLGRSYVVANHSDSRVVGYYTLAAGSISAKNLSPEASRRLPRHPVPVVLLARLAVDQSCQNAGIGARLLKDAITRAVRIAKEVGSCAIHVEAADDRAAAFYRHFGFQASPNPLSLFLPMSAISIPGEAVPGRVETKSNPDFPSPTRQGGQLKGQIWMSPDFDAPDPELERLFYEGDHFPPKTVP